MSDDAQKTDYGDKSGEGKVTSSKAISGAAHGGGSGDGSGPTGSKRDYPKGKGGGNPHRTDWNPQKIKATDWAVGGV
jgi:hypothetical protein